VAFDENFTQMVSGYDNLDVGTDTTVIVSGLESFPYYYRVKSYNVVYTSDNSNIITVLEVSAFECSARNINLNFQIFPNPTRGTISLNYSLLSAVRVSICIYDLKGNKISTLVDEELDKGEHSFQEDFSILPEGLYLVRMLAGHQSVMKKLIIMK